MRQRVFVSFLGKTAFVRSFENADEAARLTLALRRKYQETRAVFWHSPQDLQATEKWATLKGCLNADRPSDNARKGKLRLK